MISYTHDRAMQASSAARGLTNPALMGSSLDQLGFSFSSFNTSAFFSLLQVAQQNPYIGHPGPSDEHKQCSLSSNESYDCSATNANNLAPLERHSERFPVRIGSGFLNRKRWCVAGGPTVSTGITYGGRWSAKVVGYQAPPLPGGLTGTRSLAWPRNSARVLIKRFPANRGVLESSTRVEGTLHRKVPPQRSQNQALSTRRPSPERLVRHRHNMSTSRP